MNHSNRIREGSSKKLIEQVALVKSFHTNAYSMGNSQEELATVQLENYDQIAIMETW